MKNWLQRHFPTFSRWFSGVQNRLEAAYQQWGVRRWLQTTWQDARFEIDFAAVREVCRKHLDLVENVPIVTKIRQLKLQFAVGPGGLHVVPNASDSSMDPKALEAWNEAKAENFERWARSPELGSNLSLAELTLQWEGSLFDVGNVIVHLTRDEMNRPKIQTIDPLRLQTPPTLAHLENKEIIQGIRLQKIRRRVRVDGKIVEREIVTGKPLSYFIRDEFDMNSFAEIPASEIRHKYRALRPGMMVGLPEAYSVINKIIDYTDLHILEMAASKLAGKIANVRKTPTGEFNSLEARRAGMQVRSQPSGGGSPVMKTYGEFYDIEIGSEEIAIPVTDDIKNFIIERPTVAQQNYWDHITSEICAGYNVPKLLVFPFSLQGTVTRADLDVCANAFRGDFELIASLVRDIYEWQTEWALKFDRSLDGPVPSNPYGCVIRPPRAPNVDIGYTAQALETELRIGAKTIQDVYADRNEDWRTQLRQIAESVNFINQLATEYKCEPSQISSLMVAKTTGGNDKPDVEEPEKPKKESHIA